MRAAIVVVVCLIAAGCANAPAQPAETTMLSAGTWTGDGCLSVSAGDGCELVAGCGHGQFPQPIVRADGTFEINGSYRVEVGPVSIDPAPPAKFSGALRGQTLTLTVMPSGSLRPLSFVLQLTSASGRCVTACV